MLSLSTTRAALSDKGCNLRQAGEVPDDKIPASPDHVPRLIPGVNFTTWPNLKWARANSHLAALRSEFDEWVASSPISVEGIVREDGQNIDLTLRVPRGGVPSHEWALTLGDALHNLRSAFDAVAWGMAHHDGAEPKRPRDVMFPVARTEDQWNRAVERWVGDLHPDFQHRLAILQPYTYAPGVESIFTLLHDLDIQDKHQNLIAVSTNIESLEFEGGFEYVDDGVEAEVQMTGHTVEGVADGAIVATLDAGAPVRPEVTLHARPLLSMMLEHKGQARDVNALLTQLVRETRRYLDILLRGVVDERPQTSEA